MSGGRTTATETNKKNNPNKPSNLIDTWHHHRDYLEGTRCYNTRPLWW
jgi:hypothetical protein